MTDYDDLFDDTAPTDSVFADKGALDPLKPPAEIVARDDQQRALARILNGVHEGYLPTTVSIYGPPGTGKTMTTRRVCAEFAARTELVAVEYVNLKECRTIFSAANEILRELTGETKQAYVGLDGVFESIWTVLEDYPEYTVLLLDEIDHVMHDSNYDPNDFFYRLLRGEGKLARGIELSMFLLSNELLDVDLKLDSRVQSAMGGEEVFFPPYSYPKLNELMEPRLEEAFREDVLPRDVATLGIQQAAMRWGDARKTLRLFRQAGEFANERDSAQITDAAIRENLEQTDKEAIQEKLLKLPMQHFVVLLAVTSRKYTSISPNAGEIVQPVTSSQLYDSYQKYAADSDSGISERAVRDVVTDLETMGLIETWIESRGADGRAKQIETTFDPEWVGELGERYIQESEVLGMN
jgi:orc1/cdc6 family replication initiation protein